MCQASHPVLPKRDTSSTTSGSEDFYHKSVCLTSNVGWLDHMVGRSPPTLTLLITLLALLSDYMRAGVPRNGSGRTVAPSE